MIVNKVINGISFSFADLIGQFMVVSNEYERSGDSNLDGTRKSRAGILEDWTNFLETIRKTHDLYSEVELKIDTVKREVSFKKIHKWITHQVLPSLYILRECMGLSKLDEMIETSENRITGIQSKMIGKYQQEQEEYEKWLESINLR